MFNPQELWQERFRKFVKDTGRYLRYIFNGHLVVVFLFLLGTAGYYYQEWVKTLTADFPAAIIMALLLAFLLTYSPVFTFFTEADKIFLLPLETKLGNYFKRSGIVSLVMQSYLLLIMLALCMPMYAKVSGAQFQSFFFYLAILILLKGLNLMIRWKVQFYIEKKTHFIDSLVRFLLNGAILYLLFSNANPVFFVLLIVMLAILFFYYRIQVKDMGLKWEFLIEQEEKRMGAFYRVANLFTDVPNLKDQVKRRKWLDSLLAFLKYGKMNTFSHIYTRTFLRSGDYFGLFARLTVIGSLGIYFLANGIGQMLIALLFLYLTGFQLLPLWNHHQNKLWISLYPVPDQAREKAFSGLLTSILVTQSVLFGVLLLFKQEWQMAAITCISGILFTVFFVHVYSKRRRQL